ncbi:pentatricopeptide repeat-containing protein At5g66520-like [Salvia splendens]|uniref:pentatricopeptide repeat-containing protein At5g66520-like n=1 Tax=Salvia splendens TaxID=180675 RepID=UPI001C26B24F|nr:pentatricopeptide repeat-containing protein At5g66520-like [Salvia splendens]XP_042061805.1 pentatricopeptide repeat-containing protein At5g66520-like [Salvia splendens]XP_042061806.1 pentatricopeptide repeat-containing protein At5g66520-like [Salvia splendens]XP_042061807.1 pentatricopeptide repeat-containing protein At5g66520-like [Salvia splendens]XP_042061808.1 pentatricopeptide repeat-containing protein At5g66520-like [Salvia splendens]XP_042061809.1 pentatricopeptide repeat-containing
MLERGIGFRLPTDTKFLTQHCRILNQLKIIHANLVKCPFSADIATFTSLLSDAATSSSITLFSYACVIFQNLRSRTTFQYNTVIRGFVQSNQPIKAILCYKDMMRDGLIKNNYTFTPLVKACSMVSQEFERIGLLVHANIFKLGFGSDLFIASALIEFYALNLDMGTAEELFGEIPVRDVVMWTTMVDGYGKIGDIKKARELFDKMPERNVISWSSIIAAYSRKSDFREVLCLYKTMENLSLKPNESVLVSALTACAHLGALSQGLWIHSYAKKCRYVSNPILATALVDMYSKCGCVDLALTVFEENREKDCRAWNSIISGMALHGDAKKSLKLFNDMVLSGTRPTDATFVAVLTACTHARMVQEGLSLFESMTRVYKIEPKIEHYACVVDLLARSGEIEKAEKFIEDNIHGIGEGDGNVWGALLGACRIHGKVDIGNRLWIKLADKGIADYGIHALAYNMYRESGWVHEAKNIRRQIETKQMRKKPGCSTVEVDGIVEEFVAGDVLHPRAGDICKILDLLLSGVSCPITLYEYDDSTT